MRVFYYFLLFVFGANLCTAQLSSKSKLDSDPTVVYLNEHFEKPINLMVIEEMAIFADKNARRKLGYLKMDQILKIEAIADRAYRVRGKVLNTGNKVVGWVSPKAFASKDPDFVQNLQKIFERLIVVQELIANGEIALGMSAEEVTRSFGDPSERKIRRAKDGISGKMSWVDYEEIKHFTYHDDFITGQSYRRYSHTTREEKSRVDVEFEAGVVTAIEESERERRRPRRIVSAPIFYKH